MNIFDTSVIKILSRNDRTTVTSFKLLSINKPFLKNVLKSYFDERSVKFIDNSDPSKEKEFKRFVDGVFDNYSKTIHICSSDFEIHREY